MTAINDFSSRCKLCCHWSRLREGAVIGRCDVTGSRAFPHEEASCASWTERANLAIGAAARPLTSAKAAIGLVAAHLSGGLADLSGLSSLVLG